jgi:hypothetical protein
MNAHRVKPIATPIFIGTALLVCFATCTTHNKVSACCVAQNMARTGQRRIYSCLWSWILLIFVHAQHALLREVRLAIANIEKTPHCNTVHSALLNKKKGGKDKSAHAGFHCWQCSSMRHARWKSATHA